MFNWDAQKIQDEQKILETWHIRNEHKLYINFKLRLAEASIHLAK